MFKLSSCLRGKGGVLGAYIEVQASLGRKGTQVDNLGSLGSHSRRIRFGAGQSGPGTGWSGPGAGRPGGNRTVRSWGRSNRVLGRPAFFSSFLLLLLLLLFFFSLPCTMMNGSSSLPSLTCTMGVPPLRSSMTLVPNDI